MIRSRTRSGTPGRPTARRRRSSASLALATGGSFKIRSTVRCETRNCAAISLVECPASRRARTACRSSILSILLWPPLHENVGGRPKRRLQMPQDATEFREDRRQSLENPHRHEGVIHGLLRPGCQVFHFAHFRHIGLSTASRILATGRLPEGSPAKLRFVVRPAVVGPWETGPPQPRLRLEVFTPQ